MRVCCTNLVDVQNSNAFQILGINRKIGMHLARVLLLLRMLVRGPNLTMYWSAHTT